MGVRELFPAKKRLAYFYPNHNNDVPVYVMKAYGTYRYASIYSNLGTRWRWLKLHILAALPPANLPSYQFNFVTGRNPQWVWTLWRTEQALPSARNRNMGLRLSSS